MCHHIFHAIKRLFHHGRHCAVAVAIVALPTVAECCPVAVSSAFAVAPSYAVADPSFAVAAPAACAQVAVQQSYQVAAVPQVQYQAVQAVAVQPLLVQSYAVPFAVATPFYTSGFYGSNFAVVHSGFRGRAVAPRRQVVTTRTRTVVRSR